MELNFWRLTEGDDRGPGPTLGLGGVLHPGDARMAAQGLADRRFQFSGAMAMDDADEPASGGESLLHEAVDLTVHVIAGPADEVDLGFHVLDLGPDPDLAGGFGSRLPGPA